MEDLDLEDKKAVELVQSEMLKIPADNVGTFYVDLLILVKLAQRKDYHGKFLDSDIVG